MDRPTPGPPSEAGARSPGRPRRAGEFDALYAGTPPWDIGRPQPAFLRLAEAGLLRGRVLDVGCGTGEHALLAARLGLAVTGIDVAPTAISLAEGKAKARDRKVRFLVWDALDLSALGEQYDTVLDSGLFHLFDDAERPRFVDSLRAVVAPGGRYFLLCFSDRQPGTLGPRRVSQDEIRTSFADGWRVESIEAATIDVTISPVGALAWLATVTRV
jgi:SAM-dependent methyltransferase